MEIGTVTEKVLTVGFRTSLVLRDLEHWATEVITDKANAYMREKELKK